MKSQKALFLIVALVLSVSMYACQEGDEGDVIITSPTDPQPDADGDRIPDASDNCVNVANPGQEDADGDGIGDACDGVTDSDGDGIEDAADNCPAVSNPTQADVDGDGIGDACDASDDRCSPPQSNNASVTASGDGTCAATGPCLASHSVSSSSSIERILWTFPGARQSESQVATGEVRYSAPGTYSWDNLICTSTSDEDPENACCRPANGSVTFEEATP